ncbi:hypothetical protein ATANTOWER_001096 [Ataeniobius toweri]|uniref:PDZ domain-containing protein n=1 Tax=Ataeniobius toweri TaxID=208326 RepID=A0ABU7AEK3_9TELE|nr:hypothetical protein [Ataeniobius toweri]
MFLSYPAFRITYVPAHQVDEHRTCLCLPPLASISTDSPSSSPTLPAPYPEPASGPARNSSPPASSTLRLSASVKYKTTAPDPPTVRATVSFKAFKGPAIVPTITPASDTSWQLPKSLQIPPNSKEKEKDGDTVRESGDNTNEDVRVKNPEVKIKVDGKEEDNEELCSHVAWSWDQPKSVQLTRAPSQSLGISIMGGRGMGRRLSSGEMMRGVFIKHISPDSPAALNGTLRVGDRILEVSGVDLRDASHEQAVEAIRRAGDTVVLLIQSGLNRAQSPNPVNHERLSTSLSNSHNNKEAETLGSLFLSLSPANPFTPTPFKASSPTSDRMDWRSPVNVTTAATAAVEDGDDTSRSKCAS